MRPLKPTAARAEALAANFELWAFLHYADNIQFD
jgi:hypothetical protein